MAVSRKILVQATAVLFLCLLFLQSLLRLGIGTWTLKGCGIVHNRDVSSEQAILRNATLVRTYFAFPYADACGTFDHSADGVTPARREPAGGFQQRQSAAACGGAAQAPPAPASGTAMEVRSEPVHRLVTADHFPILPTLRRLRHCEAKQ